MKTNLLRTDVWRLKKQQLLTYVTQTVEVVEMHEPATLHVDVMLQRLKALKPELEKLDVSYGDALAQTADLKRINSDINNVLRAILLQTKAIGRMRGVVNDEAVAKVLPFVKRYVKASLPENLTSTVNICQRMLSELNEDSALLVSVTTLGLKAYLDEVTRLLAEEATISSSRLQQQTKRSKSVTCDLRNRVAKIASNLLNAIDVASNEYQNLDYTALVNGLNVLNTNYRTVLKSKKMRSKSNLGLKSETTLASSVKTIATVA